MITPYNPNIPVVIVHPFYTFQFDFTLDFTNPVFRSVPDYSYLVNLARLLRNHNREIIILDEENKLALTRKRVDFIRERNSVEYIPTEQSTSYPINGWSPLFDRLREIHSKEVGLAGGYYLNSPEHGELGCLGNTAVELKIDGFITYIFEGHHF